MVAIESFGEMGKRVVVPYPSGKNLHPKTVAEVYAAVQEAQTDEE